MIEIIKNMFRRKTRTLLTIFGITIGIFAFVVMGSMAEKINLLVNGGTEYYSDKVIISPAGGSLSTMPMPLKISKAEEIARVQGVAVVSGSIFLPLSEEASAVSFGPPPGIIGSDLKGDSYESFKISYSSGRELTTGDQGKVVVGADLVDKLKAKVGKSITIRDKPFTVVGIMEKTLTAPDNEVFISPADAQQILHSSLPEIIRSQITASEIVNSFTVYTKSGVDPDKLATTINAQVSDIEASGPKAFKDQVASATGVLNAILFGIALISLLVGGLSIINTMTMSISERIREIGIKKAVGAKTRNIMQEYLAEAGLIGLCGGLLGWILGALTVVAINGAMQESGTIIFLLTLRISLFAIGFSVILGIIAGIYPAYYAVKVNIVRALREG